MPKSRNKRKNKGKKPGRTPDSTRIIPASTPAPAPSAPKPRAAAAKKKSPQYKLPFSKTRIDPPRPGYGLFTMVIVFPLFAGSIIGSGGVPLSRLPEFGLIMLIVAIANWSSVYLCSPDQAGGGKGPWFGSRWLAVSGIVQFGLILLFVKFTSQLGFSPAGTAEPGAIALLTGISLSLSWPNFRLCERVEDVLFDLVMLVFSASALGVVAVYAQSGRLVPATAIIGLIPGLMLGASKVAENAALFEREGWKRSYPVTKKKGGTVLRPGGLTRLFSSLLVLVPALMVVVVPLNILPPSFLLMIIVLLATPNVAHGFFYRLRNDEETATRSRYLALAGGIAAAAAGWFAG